MGKRGRRIRKMQRQHKTNEHHFLWPRTNWNYGFGLLFRYVFTAQVPIDIHNELHHDILNEIPRPREELLEIAWEKYLKRKAEIDEYGMLRKLAWLYVVIPDAEFRRAMQAQIDFFTERLGGSD